MDSIKQIVELGSFGVLVAILIGLGWMIRTVVPKLIDRLDAHLTKTESLQAGLNATLALIAADNRVHYERDSAEQRNIDDKLSKILLLIEDEHEKTRAAILATLRGQ